MFDYKQRPFSSKVTDVDYDRATGRTPNPSPFALISGLTQIEAGKPCPICGVIGDHFHAGWLS
jgi:hypothetical protein